MKTVRGTGAAAIGVILLAAGTALPGACLVWMARTAAGAERPAVLTAIEITLADEGE